MKGPNGLQGLRIKSVLTVAYGLTVPPQGEPIVVEPFTVRVPPPLVKVFPLRLRAFTVIANPAMPMDPAVRLNVWPAALYCIAVVQVRLPPALFTVNVVPGIAKFPVRVAADAPTMVMFAEPVVVAVV